MKTSVESLGDMVWRKDYEELAPIAKSIPQDAIDAIIKAFVKTSRVITSSCNTLYLVMQDLKAKNIEIDRRAASIRVLGELVNNEDIRNAFVRVVTSSIRVLDVGDAEEKENKFQALVDNVVRASAALDTTTPHTKYVRTIVSTWRNDPQITKALDGHVDEANMKAVEDSWVELYESQVQRVKKEKSSTSEEGSSSDYEEGTGSV